MEKVTAFLRDVKVELSRVIWPTSKQTLQYTYVVIGMSLGVAVFLGALDALFGYGLTKLIGQ